MMPFVEADLFAEFHALRNKLENCCIQLINLLTNGSNMRKEILVVTILSFEN